MSTVYVALDVEATGMNPTTDRIIEIAAVKFTLDRVLDRWETLVRPGVSVPFAITSLTGITQAAVNGAPTFAAIAPTLRAFVRNHPIVGQSIEMDIGMLQAAGLPMANPLVDTFELAALLLPQLPAYSLGAVAQALGLPLDTSEQHRARTDAELARLVFARLWERVLDFEVETLGEVVRLTAGTGWPLHPLFVEAQQVKARESFGTSLGGALRAALGVSADAQAGELGYLMPRTRAEPLQPTGQRPPIDGDALTTMLAVDGPLAQQFTSYEFRPQQAQMLRAVVEAFNESHQLMVEAGTGTGKSFAYLLPAVVAAVQRGEAVVIATKTIQLQDQLFHKDLPALANLLQSVSGSRAAQQLGLPASFRAAIVKGRSNYLCLRRWFALRRGPALPPEEVRTMVKILLWLQTTETGDRSELRLLPGEEVTWARVMATADSCTPTTCPYNRRGQCFLQRARRSAEAAHIIIVNHALLLSDMASESRVLPDYKHLIIDEAHRLEDEATSQLGYHVDRRSMLELLDGLARRSGQRAEGLGPEVATQLRISKVPVTIQQSADRLVGQLIDVVAAARPPALILFDALAGFLDLRGDQSESHDPRVRLTPAVRLRSSWAAVERAWDDLGDRLDGIGQALASLSSLVERLEPAAVVEYETLTGDLTSALRQIADCRHHLQAIIANPDPQMIAWCEANRAQQLVSLWAAPLHVGPTLEAGLYTNRQTIVLTSATLTTDNSFEYMRERLSLSDAYELQLGSPFDYRRSTLLYLVEDLPEPGQPGYQRRLEQGLVGLCLATDGRALALFTSHSALRATYSAIKGPLEARGILVLGQRIDGSPRQLVERLKATGRAVILGTASFWEGVDVVGDALSVLVITKLPFQVPSDPIFASRSEQYDEPFPNFAVPQTVLTFKQGFGRLIRSSSDRGIVAIFDRRLVSKSYGPTFLHSLPACTERRGALEKLPMLARSWLEGAAPER